MPHLYELGPGRGSELGTGTWSGTRTGTWFGARYGMRYWVGCGTMSGFGFESLTFGGITLRTRGPLTVLYLIVETKPITSCEGFVAELTVVGYGTETFLFVFDLIWYF